MANKKENSTIKTIITVIMIYIGLCIVIDIINGVKVKSDYPDRNYSSDVFYLLSSSENEGMDSELKSFAAKEGIDLSIEYDDTLKITRRLNQGEQFDAVWLSNSIWMYAIDSSVKISNTKSTSINPVVFAVRKSKADELGFVGRDIYTQDIVDAVQNGRLFFSMPNPVTTNSGASAYLGILSNLAGSPEVLTSEMLDNEDLREKLKTFFSGVERSSGDESYLENMFVQGEYEAVFAYESSIISINKKLQEAGKEPLYALYPVDGVSIADSPIGFIDQKDEKKKEQYEKIVSFLLGNKGQSLLASYGRRTWYGGVTTAADKSIFNPEWGIDTNRYISPIKYPSTPVIRKALSLYQSSLRKPVHVVFCLDYSGSMWGEGITSLRDAMDYILTERASDDLLQFTGEDIVEVIPFASSVGEVWSAHSEEELDQLNQNIKSRDPSGGTALYPAVEKAISLLAYSDNTQYNTSVIVLTDGQGNVGRFDTLRSTYQQFDIDIPIYSIQFASADRAQLEQMAELSNGKVFDGTTSLIDAFMEVRGYN